VIPTLTTGPSITQDIPTSVVLATSLVTGSQTTISNKLSTLTPDTFLSTTPIDSRMFWLLFVYTLQGMISSLRLSKIFNCYQVQYLSHMWRISAERTCFWQRKNQLLADTLSVLIIPAFLNLQSFLGKDILSVKFQPSKLLTLNLVWNVYSSKYTSLCLACFSKEFHPYDDI